MRTIFKFRLETARIRMSAGAKIIHLGVDPMGHPCVWAEVETEAPLVNRRLAIVGTGQPLPEGGKHIGSYLDAPFVWHVYDLGEVA